MAYEKEEKAGTDSASNDEAILKSCQKALKECIEEEESERAKMLDDLRFCTLDQWPKAIREDRENDVENGPRPCLTIDKINQYITQVVNDMRQGKPGIIVRPQDDAADPETAKILKGLIRNIEDQSSADIPYSVAGESAAKIGLGYFRITNEHVSADSFDQELFIRPIPNTFSVYLSKHLMPDGSDAKRGYIAEAMPLAKFKEAYPNAKYSDEYFADMDATVMSYWRTQDTITLVEEYVLEQVEEEVYFLSDGTTMPAKDYEKWPEEAGPQPGIQDKRRAVSEQLRWRKMTGCEVLDKRDLPGKYIPIVEVVGREAWVDGRRVLWGLVRPAKDSLRMYNYWASLITEKMALAPKTPYIGAKGQFDGVDAKWKQANKKNYPYLEYNPIDVQGNALPRPERQPPTPIEAALLQQMQVIEHDVQTSLGMFKAAVGETESQQSGRAILALQKESDTGTYHFGANLGVSIRHAGRILVDLIPHYYDTRRVVRILGEDGDVQTVTLDPNHPQAVGQEQTEKGLMKIYNPGVGKYDISITVGPSYNTKRMEAQATFIELARSAKEPAIASIANYLAVKNSDFSGADEAAKMLKALLPPPALAAVSQGQPIPPEAQAKIAQMTQMLQMAQQKIQEDAQEIQKLQTGAQAKMAAVQVDSQEAQQKMALAQQEAQAQLALQKQKQDGELQLAREKAEAEIAIKRAVAEADHQIEIANLHLSAQKQQAETQLKVDDKKAVESESAMPQFVQALQAIVQAQAQTNEQIAKALSAVAEAVGADRTVEMSTADGRKMSAVSRSNRPRTVQ